MHLLPNSLNFGHIGRNKRQLEDHRNSPDIHSSLVLNDLIESLAESSKKSISVLMLMSCIKIKLTEVVMSNGTIFENSCQYL